MASSAAVVTTKPGIAAKLAVMLSLVFMVMVVLALAGETTSPLPVQLTK